MDDVKLKLEERKQALVAEGKGLEAEFNKLKEEIAIRNTRMSELQARGLQIGGALDELNKLAVSTDPTVEEVKMEVTEIK